MFKLLSCPFLSSHLLFAPCSTFLSIIPGDSVLLAGIQQEIVSFFLHFFIQEKHKNSNLQPQWENTALSSSFVPHRATFPHPVPIPELFFLDQEDSSHQAGSSFGVRCAPSCSVWGCCLRGKGVVYSQGVLDTELVLLVPVPLLVCVPTIHKHTRGVTPHFLLKCGNFCDFTGISLRWPPAFGFISLFILFFALFLICRRAGVSQGHKLCGNFAPQERTFPCQQLFPITPSLPFPEEEDGSWFPTQPFKCLEVDSVELSCLGWNYFINLKMKLLKAFMGLEMCGLKSPGFGYWCVKNLCVGPRWQPGNNRNKLIKVK